MILASNSRIWWIGLVVAIGLLGWSFATDFAGPWTDQIDGNGACWSQSAHNTLRAGIVATAGVPSAFYFGTPPIPPEGFYTHHPPLLSLMLTAMFATLGEAEWVARLLPITFSFGGIALLWLLVKDCTNARTAAFAVLAFAAMPMELRYGRMVNFEAVNLVWMLAAMLGLRRWQKSVGTSPSIHDGQRWWWLTILAAVLCIWTAWLGYLFVLVLCFLPPPAAGRRSRLTSFLIIAMVVSLLLFLLQIRLARADAWHDLMAAMNYRMAHAGSAVSWRDWVRRIGSLLMMHIQPVFWFSGIIGAGTVWKSARESPLRWLGWSAGCFFVMSTLYVVLFRNASSIHDYASFYFTVPVAMMTGVALDGICRWCESRSTAFQLAATSGALLLLGFLVFAGERQTLALRRQFLILTDERPEPPELITELGRAIRDGFGSDVAVICNFLPSYGPQLHYYAQHELLPYVFTADEWAEAIADPENAPVGGVIWLQDPRAQEIVASLPPGTQKRVTIRDIPFCFWRPATSDARLNGEVPQR
jgi:hypothetical protein